MPVSGKRHAHPECLQAENEKKHAKQAIQKEIRNAANSDPDYKKLVHYICELFNMIELTPLIRSQIDRYHERYDLKYSGIQLTLDYYYKTLGHDIKDEYGIGIVLSYYEKAKQFYIQRKKVEKSTQVLDKQSSKRVINVNVKTEPRNRMINIDDIK